MEAQALPTPTDDSRMTLSNLVGAVQELADARDLTEVRAIVCRAARRLTGANAATYLVRDGRRCLYAEEDSDEPLWKGQTFPINECIGGWVMVYRQAVTISDIELDDRLDATAYSSTFVRSIAMAPVRSSAPIAAIGVYWNRVHTPSQAELSALQSLADATAVTLENVSLNAYALSDSLSGHYNRRGFFTRGAERIASNRNQELATSVVFAVIDGLQQINDQHGYEAGDEAIRRAASALQRTCRSDAVIGRIAGDAFAICGGIETLPSTNADELERALSAAAPDNGRPVDLALGIAIGRPGEECDLDSLVADANRDMYDRRGGNVGPVVEPVTREVTRD
jgi:diguanylate cyclase (GGDEF)-like protein